MTIDDLIDKLQPFGNLIFLTLALVLPLAYFGLPRQVRGTRSWDSRFHARVGLTLILFIWSSAHFMSAERLTHMLPDWVPHRLMLIYLTGALELALAVFLWLPSWTRWAGAAIVGMLVLFLPAIVYAAWSSLPFSGNVLGPAYLLVRVPYQLFVAIITLWATGWLGRTRL